MDAQGEKSAQTLGSFLKDDVSICRANTVNLATLAQPKCDFTDHEIVILQIQRSTNIILALFDNYTNICIYSHVDHSIVKN